MIAVGAPAFDRAYREETNTTRRRARLLGVAGTDVPVEDIDKLALPYKVKLNYNCNLKGIFILILFLISSGLMVMHS